MYGRIHDPGMGPYPPRMAIALRTPGWGFHTVGGGSTRESTVFVHGLLKLWMYGSISDQGMGYYLPRVALAQRISGRGFYTMGGGIDPGDHRFSPRFAGVVDKWMGC